MKQVNLSKVQKALLYIQALGHTEADIVSTGDDPVEDGLTVTVQSKQVLIGRRPACVPIAVHQVASVRR